MEKIIRTNETGKMLRIDDNYSEIFALESALLKGDKLKANVRCRIARETKNPEILRLCIHDSAITVVTAAKDNPILTPEMRLEISKIEKAWEQSKLDKIQEDIKPIVSINNNQYKRGRTNWWSIVSLLLFFVICVLSYALYESYERINSLDWQRNNSENTVYQVNAELRAKKREIRTLQKQLQSKDATIDSFRNRLPQTYYTIYPAQELYYYNGSYVYSGMQMNNDSGMPVTIYLAKDGYGMMESGWWVPMRCLQN